MIELSEREKTFLKEAIAGKSYREIGLTNFLNPRTVENYFVIIAAKLGASCRNETFYLAGKQGILD